MSKAQKGSSVFVAVLVVLIGALVLAACGTGLVVGSGKSVTETREVSNFDAVELSFVGELNITQGDEEKLTITADDNIMPLITTEVDDGVLKIGSKSSIGVPNMTPLRYELTVKDLRSLALTGAGSAEVGKLQTEDLALRLSGAGSLTLEDVEADSIAAQLSGTGSIEAAGKTNQLAVQLSGAGSYNGQDLQSNTAQISISGLGGAEVWAEETLDASISGAGSINYYGNPTVTKSVSGLGSVNEAGNK